jgi:hypothetical protein
MSGHKWRSSSVFAKLPLTAQFFTKPLIFAEAYFLGNPAQFLGRICGVGFGSRRGNDLCGEGRASLPAMPARLRRSYYRNEKKMVGATGIEPVTSRV